MVVTARDRQALAAAVRRAVDADRPPQRPDRGGLHRATRWSRSSATSTRSRSRSRDRTRSSTRRASARSSSAASSCPRSCSSGTSTTSFIAVIGGFMVAYGAMSLGDVQAFIQYSRQFTQPLTQLGVDVEPAAVRRRVRRAGLRAPRRRGAVARPRRAAARATTPDGRVAFENVSFRYDADEPAHRRPVARRGARARRSRSSGRPAPARRRSSTSSCGSTSSTAGRITLDGVDIAAMTRDDLRGEIGMVLQDTWLFDGTIRDNIAYGRPGATEEEIHEAARADLRRPLRPRAARRLRHGDRRRGQQPVDGREAAHHHRAGVPRRSRRCSSSTRRRARSTPAPRSSCRRP